MRRGNCLLYAVLMLWLVGGEIEPRIIRAGRVPKIRFYHVTSDGLRTYFAPLYPKRGISAWAHSIWYEGKVKVSDRVSSPR